MVILAMKKTKTIFKIMKTVAKKKKNVFQIDVELIAYDKKVFFKNSWNVIRWYMFKDSKKLATKKTQQ